MWIACKQMAKSLEAKPPRRVVEEGCTGPGLGESPGVREEVRRGRCSGDHCVCISGFRVGMYGEVLEVRKGREKCCN